MGATKLLVGLMVALIPIMGVLLAATPWLMRSRECFAVTVPASAQSDSEVRALKRGYAAAMLVCTVLLTALDAALLALGMDQAAVAVLAGACVGLSLLSFALMLRARSRVRAIKERRGWKAEGDVRSAVVAEGEVPRPVSLWWEALNLPVAAVTVALGVVGYAAMPDQVPMHVGFDGQVNGWAEKGPLAVALAPCIQLFLTAVMVLAHWTIVRSKCPNAPDMPVSSAYAYCRFARAQSVYMVTLGVALNLSLVCMQAAMTGGMDMAMAGLVVAAVAVAAVVGAAAIAVLYGQAGARVVAKVGDDAAMPFDDDRYWKLGVLYVNRDDPSLFVPARFGVGWTCNFARPAVWAVMGGVVALTVALVALAAAVG